MSLSENSTQNANIFNPFTDQDGLNVSLGLRKY